MASMSSTSCVKPKRVSLGKLLSGSFMVFGTTVGAGMLGIPAMTAGAGFMPALLVTFLVWIFMAATGLLFLEVTLKMPQGSNLISLSQRFLGRGGKWVSAVLFLFLYYCLLVAYFAGGSPLLGQLCLWVGIPLSALTEKILFLAIFGGVVFLGVKWINKANLILTACMLLSYVFLVSLGASAVEYSRFPISNYALAFGAVPVLFSAFGFHNVVPPLATFLHRDKKVLRLSILLGTFFALALYVVWQWLVLGSVPVDVIAEVRAKGLPVTYALQKASHVSSIYILGQLFAFFALTTSFLGVGFSFVDFIQDGFAESKIKVRRFFCSFLTLVPPFICILLNPAVFEKALGLAGGIGESILNGILPVLLFVKMRSSLKHGEMSFLFKATLWLLVLLSLGAFFIEVRSL